jgi:hypothetical protein
MKGQLRRMKIVAATQIIRLRVVLRAGVVRDCLLILVCGFLLEELPSFLTDLFPIWSRHKVNWFLKPGYYHPTQINWMIKYIADDLFSIGKMYVIAKLAKLYSTYLFLSVVVFLGYELSGFAMLFWDFKTTHIIFYDFLFTSLLLIKGVFKGYSQKTVSRLRSLF